MNTDTDKKDKKNLNFAAQGIVMSPDEMIRELRELKGWSQLDLARATGISQTNISAIENGRVEIGKSRSLTIAKALHVHPASIMFADYKTAA